MGKRQSFLYLQVSECVDGRMLLRKHIHRCTKRQAKAKIGELDKDNTTLRVVDMIEF